MDAKVNKSGYSEKENTDRVSIEQYNEAIDEALDQVKAGNYVTHEQLEKEMEQR